MAKGWLVKSEPDCYSFADLLRDKVTAWEGVRNYQARNYMRDEMTAGDPVLFYHSSTAVPAVVGLARVAREAYPDPTQFDPSSQYYDPKATQQAPRWQLVDIEGVAALPRPVSLAELKDSEGLAGMLLLQRGSRLSVMPVALEHLERVLEMGGLPRGRW